MRQAANIVVMRSMPVSRGSQTHAAPQASVAQTMPVMNVSRAKMRPASQSAMAVDGVSSVRRNRRFVADCSVDDGFL